ncbi:MAG: phage integrase N-terminal SAM-like domain-containing protein [Thermincola sp.]|nr:phage integrase N-terminal SAM-like domain-containing protein [Thermincola sp.]
MPCSMEGFSQYLVTCNKMPESRARMYVNMVRKFHNHVGKPYVDIKQFDVRSYLSFLKKYEHLKERSIYEHLVAISKFYKYLWSKGEVAKVPSEGLRIKWKKGSPGKLEKRKTDSGGN